MGLKKEHRCPKCGYNVVTSAGLDFGMMITVKTHICNDCEVLTDVVVSRQKDECEPQIVYLEKNDYQCTECGGKNLIAWNIRKKPCPKCGTKMTSGEGIEMLWD